MMAEGGSNVLGEVAVDVYANIGRLESDFKKVRTESNRLDKDMQKVREGFVGFQEAGGKLGRELETLTKRLDPLHAASIRYAKDLDVIERAQREGLLTLKQATELHKRSTGVYNEAARAQNNLATFSEKARTQLKLLGIATATAVAVGLVALVKQSFNTAQELANMSEKIGISAEELQKWQYVAKGSGVEVSELNLGLENLSRSMGKAAAGSKRESEAFKLLEVSLKDSAGQAKNVNDVLPELADSLLRITDTNQRAAVAQVLFGESAKDILPALENGSAGINSLREAAEELGVVLSNEQIRRLDEANRKYEKLKEVLSATIAAEVADNADAIIGFTNAFIELTHVMRDAKIELEDFLDTKIPSGFLLFGPTGVAAQLAVAGAKKMAGGGGEPQVRLDLTEIAKQTAARDAKDKPIDASGFLARNGRSGRSGAGAAERARLRGLRNDKAFEDEMARFETEILKMAEQQAGNAEERAALSTKILDIEKERFDRTIQLEGPRGTKKYDAGEVQKLKAQFEELDAAKRRAIDLKKRDDILKDQLSIDTSRMENEEELLSVERGLAKSRTEQKDIEKTLLNLQHRMEIARLDALIAASTTSDTEKQIAEERKAFLKKIKPLQEDAIERDYRSAVQRFIDTINLNSQQLDDLRDQIEADKGAERIARSAQFADDLGDAFANVGRDVLALKNPLEILQNLLVSLTQTFNEEVLIRPLQEWARNKIGAPIAERVTDAPAGPYGIWIKNLGDESLTATPKITSLGVEAQIAATRMSQGYSVAVDSTSNLANQANKSAEALSTQSVATAQFGNAIAQAMALLSSAGGGGGFLSSLLSIGASAIGASIGPSASTVARLTPSAQATIAANPAIFHEGGVVGSDGMPKRRSRRGLGQDEHWIIAKNDERIIPPGPSRAFDGILDTISSGRLPKSFGLGGRMGGGSRTYYGPTVNLGGVNFPSGTDERTARRSGRQLASEIQRQIAISSRKGYRSSD